MFGFQHEKNRLVGGIPQQKWETFERYVQQVKKGWQEIGYILYHGELWL